MKMRPNSITTLISGISLLLASTHAQAGDTFFSFNVGYSNYGNYVSPYRYIYTPAYYYNVPSPFFFGYSSYYYPVFPYYYTPVVYYRPVFPYYSPYYSPYAYRPNWIYYNQPYAYSSIYPINYIYGYYPYNRYYSHYPQSHYKYRNDHHRDHFESHNNNQQYAGPHKRYSPGNRLSEHQRPGQRNVNSTTLANANKQQPETRALDKRRTTLQQRPGNQRTEGRVNNPSRNDKRIIAETGSRPVLQRGHDRQDTRTKQSDNNVNNEKIDRLINRDRNTSRPAMERNNNAVQRRVITNQQNQRQPQAQPDMLAKNDDTSSRSQAREINQQQQLRNNMTKSDNSSLRQQTAMTERSKQTSQRQIVQQQPVRNNSAGPVNNNPGRQAAVTDRGSKNSRQSNPVIARNSESTDRINVRGGGQMSLRQNGVPGVQQRGTFQRSMGPAGFTR